MRGTAYRSGGKQCVTISVVLFWFCVVQTIFRPPRRDSSRASSYNRRRCADGFRDRYLWLPSLPLPSKNNSKASYIGVFSVLKHSSAKPPFCNSGIIHIRPRRGNNPAGTRVSWLLRSAEQMVVSNGCYFGPEQVDAAETGKFRRIMATGNDISSWRLMIASHIIIAVPGSWQLASSWFIARWRAACRVACQADKGFLLPLIRAATNSGYVLLKLPNSYSRPNPRSLKPIGRPVLWFSSWCGFAAITWGWIFWSGSGQLQLDVPALPQQALIRRTGWHRQRPQAAVRTIRGGKFFAYRLPFVNLIKTQNIERNYPIRLQLYPASAKNLHFRTNIW